jgi:hypothetical protein
MPNSTTDHLPSNPICVRRPIEVDTGTQTASKHSHIAQEPFFQEKSMNNLLSLLLVAATVFAAVPYARASVPPKHLPALQPITGSRWAMPQDL